MNRFLIILFSIVLLTNFIKAEDRLSTVTPRNKEYALELSDRLLLPNRHVGIIVAPSFDDLYGLSLSQHYDTLTLIIKDSPMRGTLSGFPKKEDPRIMSIGIDCEFGRKLSKFIDIAVSMAMPYERHGKDGTSTYFFTENDSIARCWSPEKNSNCYTLVQYVKLLYNCVLNNNYRISAKLLSQSIDDLIVRFENAPELPPYQTFRNIINLNGKPYSKMTMYASFEYPIKEFSITVPDTARNIEREQMFFNFCNRLMEWMDEDNIPGLIFTLNYGMPLNNISITKKKYCIEIALDFEADSPNPEDFSTGLAKAIHYLNLNIW